MNIQETLLYKDSDNTLLSKTLLYSDLINASNIYIFGAKQKAVYTHKYLAGRFEIKGFIVSNKLDNPDHICGKEVLSFDMMAERALIPYDITIILPDYDVDMVEYLRGFGFDKILSSPVDISQRLTIDDIQYCRRFFDDMEILKPSDRQKLSHEEIVRQVFVYAVTCVNNNHKENRQWNDRYIHYIQAGAALTDQRIAGLTDATGNNISTDNPELNEQTVSWWISHNDHEHPFVGLFHYSRGLQVDYDILSDMIVDDFDMIIGLPMVTKQAMIFRTEGIIYDAIKKTAPEYLLAASEYFTNRIFFRSNLMIAKNQVYKDCTEFVFRIIGKIKDLMIAYKAPKYPRQLGFYAEHLTNIFIFMHRKTLKLGFVEEIECFGRI